MSYLQHPFPPLLLLRPTISPHHIGILASYTDRHVKVPKRQRRRRRGWNVTALSHAHGQIQGLRDAAASTVDIVSIIITPPFSSKLENEGSKMSVGSKESSQVISVSLLFFMIRLGLAFSSPRALLFVYSLPVISRTPKTDPRNQDIPGVRPQAISPAGKTTPIIPHLLAPPHLSLSNLSINTAASSLPALFSLCCCCAATGTLP